MTNLIIILVIALVLFFTRNWWSKKLVSLFKKETRKTQIIAGESIFDPSETIRTFIIALDIQETGSGKVKISINKKGAKLAPSDIIEI